jgi:hypothetical protein
MAGRTDVGEAMVRQACLGSRWMKYVSQVVGRLSQAARKHDGFARWFVHGGNPYLQNDAMIASKTMWRNCPLVVRGD